MNSLDVVNRCLGVLGETPLPSLGDNHIYEKPALDLLEQKNREIQAPGRWFNELHTTLSPDPGDGNRIKLPPDTLEVITGNPQFVQRGEYLYDLTGTYEFTRSLRVRCVILVPFEDLPLVPQAAIVDQVVLAFQQAYDADSADTRLLAATAEASWKEFGRAEIRNRQVNMVRRHIGLQQIHRVTRGVRGFTVRS